jgi:hypothetical protein
VEVTVAGIDIFEYGAKGFGVISAPAVVKTE